MQDAPLAVAAAPSIAPQDLVPQDLVYENRVGETYGVTYSPTHRWFYFSEMGADEGLLLKCFDSKTDGRARFAPHTSFKNPNAPADAPPAPEHRDPQLGLPPRRVTTGVRVSGVAAHARGREICTVPRRARRNR